MSCPNRSTISVSRDCGGAAFPWGRNMATDPISGLIEAVRLTLIGEPTIRAIVGLRVYDRAPADAAFPYITLFEVTATDESSSDSDAEAVTLDVHVWTRPDDRSPATRQNRDLMALIRAALHNRRPPIVGRNLVLLQVTARRGPLSDPDGVTLHGIVSARALVGHD